MSRRRGTRSLRSPRDHVRPAQDEASPGRAVPDRAARPARAVRSGRGAVPARAGEPDRPIGDHADRIRNGLRARVRRSAAWRLHALPRRSGGRCRGRGARVRRAQRGGRGAPQHVRRGRPPRSRNVGARRAFAGVPEQILCRADCAGLCAGCGANLNDEECRCAPPEPDTRWSKLSELKERLGS